MLSIFLAGKEDNGMNLWSGLLANMAVLMAIVCIWSNGRPHLLPFTLVQRRALFGFLSAGGVIAVMNMTVPLGDGVIVDLRTSIVTISALFGGPLSAAITVVIGAAYRLYLGGAGADAGAFSLIASAAVGVTGFYLSRSRRPDWRFLAVTALNGSIAGVLCFALLPLGIAIHLIENAAVPLIVLNTLSSFVCGLAMLNELRRRDLAQSNHIYRMAINSFPDCLNVKDADGRFLIANEATARLMNAGNAAALIGKTDADFYPPDVAMRVMAEEREALRRGTPTELEQKVSHPNKNDIWLSTLKVPLFGEDGTLSGLITHNRDISESRKLELELATSRQHLEDAIENMPGGVAMFDPRGVLIYSNSHYSSMFPMTADLRVPGVNYRDILKGALERGEFMVPPASLQADLVKEPSELMASRDKAQSQLSDGRWIETHVRFTTGGACFFLCNDISRLKAKEVQLVALNAKLSAAAATDGLTGLANRRAFDEYLNDELKRSSRGSLPLSLILMDIDRFKAFNDTYGHPAGDECIKIVAACLQDVARRPSDMAARYGGEELALVLPLTNEEQALRIAQRLQTLIHERAVPHIGSEKGIVTASIGVTSLEMGDSTDLTPAQFVCRADDALYQAKGAGRDMVCLWSADPAAIRESA